MFYVYVLKLSTGKFYIGQTNNIENRFVRHQTGQVQSTKAFLPVTLVYYEKFGIRAESMQREKYLKSLKSHKILQELINTFDGLIV